MKIQNSRRSDVLLLITYFVFYTLVLSLLLAFAAAHIPLFRNGAVYYGAYGAGTLLTFLIFFWQKKKVLREDFEKFRAHFGKNCRVVFLALLIIYLCNILINLLLQHSISATRIRMCSAPGGRRLSLAPDFARRCIRTGRSRNWFSVISFLTVSIRRTICSPTLSRWSPSRCSTARRP